MLTRWSMESRIVLAVAGTGGIVLFFWALQLVLAPGTAPFDWLVWGLAALLVLLLAIRLRRRVLGPVQSLANIIEAIRFEDYALRVRTDRGGVMTELAHEINRLAEDLRSKARQEQESRALLEKVMQEIDLPVFAFDAQERLVIANPAAERLVGARLQAGSRAGAIGVESLLAEEDREPVSLTLPGGGGRFVVRRRPFRMEGKPHELLVLAEVSSALRAERQEAWQRLIRVLGHEINNSLAPIKSIAETLAKLARGQNGRLDHEDFADGLDRIAERANSLGRFVGGYAALARLPAPRTQPVGLQNLANRVAAMEPRLVVRAEGPDLRIEADRDQLEQALINLVKNAADSAENHDGGVVLRWNCRGSGTLIEVLDNGPGPPDSENLFVPFFTTKPGGSGIGLLLARRIAELHDGWLTLEHREDGVPGAHARLWLPGQNRQG
jgi:nitrogen fixation/metabolism regulation signal transduction histidine kinase